MTNANGTCILSHTYFCMEEGRCPRNDHWPYQPRPRPHHRETWQKFVDTLCNVPTLHLKTPLGIWYCPPSNRWQAYYDSSLQVILIQQHHQWHHYPTYNKYRRFWIIPRNQCSIDNTPPHGLQNLQPIDIIKTTQNYYKVTIPIPITTTITRPPNITLWHQYSATLTSWDKQIVQATTPDLPQLLSRISTNNENWIAVHDGSYYNNQGSYAWTIQHHTNKIISGKGQVSGNPITSFRAELHGLVAWHCCLFHLTNFYDIMAKITIQPYSDNTKVVEYHQHILNNTLPKVSFFDDHDYFLQLQLYQQKLNHRGIHILPTKKVTYQKHSKEADHPIEILLLQQMDNLSLIHI